MQKIKANVRASINVAPKGSQVVLISLVLVLFFCLACTIFSAPLGIERWVPSVAAAILLIVIVGMWFSSAQHIDDASIPPFNVVSSDGDTSTSISLNHKSLLALQDAQALEQLLSIVQHRKPLPEPDGLIDENGTLVPQSQSAAQERVEAINEQARQAKEELQSVYQTPRGNSEVTQSSIDCEPEIAEPGTCNRTVDES
ncbi:MAG: hypothetical protein OXF33_05010 [Rhodospirillales bacterium]|nr:hypothetical protein [Rhodospirillales bacterium]